MVEEVLEVGWSESPPLPRGWPWLCLSPHSPLATLPSCLLSHWCPRHSVLRTGTRGSSSVSSPQPFHQTRFGIYAFSLRNASRTWLFSAPALDQAVVILLWPVTVLLSLSFPPGSVFCVCHPPKEENRGVKTGTPDRHPLILHGVPSPLSTRLSQAPREVLPEGDLASQETAPPPGTAKLGSHSEAGVRPFQEDSTAGSCPPALERTGRREEMVFPELRSWRPARWSSSTERAAIGGDESPGGAQSLLRCCPAPRDEGTTAYVSVPPTLQSPASVPHWLNRARSRGTLQTEVLWGNSPHIADQGRGWI